MSSASDQVRVRRPAPHLRLRAAATAFREREEWAFFRVLPRASVGLAVAWWALILVRGLLPAVFSIAVGLLVTGLQTGEVGLPLTIIGVVFALIQLLGPVHAELSTNLGDRLSDWLHDTLLAATTEPTGIRHLESPRLADQLTSARDFDLGMVGPPMHLSVGLIAGGLVSAATGATQAAVLGGYRWWAPLLVGGAWLSTHWLLRESSTWDRDTGEVLDASRRAEYNYRLAVAAPAAKEIRLFGLSDWIVARFAADRRHLVDLRWHVTRLRQKPMRWVILVLVVANGILLWSLARDAISGAISVGAVTVFAQAAIGANLLAFGGLNWALPLAAHSVASVLRLREDMRQVGHLPAGARGRRPGRPVGRSGSATSGSATARTSRPCWTAST
jgi:ATP-binding cassette subfamily B protein